MSDNVTKSFKLFSTFCFLDTITLKESHKPLCLLTFVNKQYEDSSHKKDILTFMLIRSLAIEIF